MEECGSSEAKREEKKQQKIIAQRISKNIHRIFSIAFDTFHFGRSNIHTHTHTHHFLRGSHRPYENTEVEEGEKGVHWIQTGISHIRMPYMCVCLYGYYCDDNFFCIHPFFSSFKTKQTNDVRMGPYECVCVYLMKKLHSLEKLTPHIGALPSSQRFFLSYFTHAHIKWCYIRRSAKRDNQNQ